MRAARGSHNAGSRARGRDHHRRRAAAPQLCLGHQRRRWIRNDQAAHVADQPAGQSDQHQRSPCFLPRLLRAHGSAARRCISRRHDASAAWQQVGSGNASARERAAAARRVAGSPIPARDARPTSKRWAFRSGGRGFDQNDSPTAYLGRGANCGGAPREARYDALAAYGASVHAVTAPEPRWPIGLESHRPPRRGMDDPAVSKWASSGQRLSPPGPRSRWRLRLWWTRPFSRCRFRC